MARPRALDDAEEAALAQRIREIGLRPAARELQQRLGLAKPPMALCQRAMARVQASAPPPPPASSPPSPAAPPPPPPELDPDPIDPDLDDDLEVLKQCRAKALEQLKIKATGEASRRVLLLIVSTVERLTVRIDKLRRQRSPDRKVGILILPPEGEHLEASVRGLVDRLAQERDQAQAELEQLRRAAASG